METPPTLPGEIPAEVAEQFRSPFDSLYGLRVTGASTDRVTAEVALEAKHHQPYGIVHGGVWCALVETAASIGAGTWFGERGNVVGVSNHTDFLHAVREGEVVARATPIHRGRLQQLWLVEITDDSGKVAARGQVRLQNLESADSLGKRGSS